MAIGVLVAESDAGNREIKKTNVSPIEVLKVYLKTQEQTSNLMQL